MTSHVMIYTQYLPEGEDGPWPGSIWSPHKLTLSTVPEDRNNEEGKISRKLCVRIDIRGKEELSVECEI